MSVESEILRIQHNIANTYAAVSEKGGEVPLQPTSANLAAAVASIPVGVTQEELSQALLTKQDKLVGQPGQVVGFNAQGAAQAVQGWSNPNLLDNWYFADPVNQRGAGGTITAAGYFIDRWKLVSGSITLGADGLVLNGTIAQILETAPTSAVTARALTGAGIMPADYDTATKTVSITGSGIPIIAAKLELGPVQTLAHQDTDGNWVLNDPPPNKALELAKCQRYFEISAWNLSIAVALSSSEIRFCGSYYYKVHKRIPPAITIGSPRYGQEIVVYDTVAHEDIYGLVASEPIAWNSDMISPRISDPQNRFVPGRLYQVIIPDYMYNMSADL